MRTGARTCGVGALAVAAISLAACRDFDVQDINAPTQEVLTGSPTRPVLSRAANGIMVQAFNDLATELEFYSIYGREGYNLLGNDPRETGEQIRGPQDAGGRSGGSWLGKYQAIRTINVYLAALDRASGLTAAEVRASAGFAKTIKAWHLFRLAVRSGATGIPVDVDRSIADDPAPFVSFSEAMAAASALMDEAQADLQAGGSEFPFAFVPGYTGFTTPATFLEFNRALAADILVHRATFNDCTACWAEASTAIDASFITTSDLPNSLDIGVYYGYTGAAGELSNPVTEAIASNRYWVHPSIVTGVQTRANGEPDLRLTTKVRDAGRLRELNEIEATHKPVMYNSASNPEAADPGADIPWITNEELILLRAEIRWNTGNKLGAIEDINLIRQHAGGLPPSTLTIASSDEAFITELLYNRLYSLLWQQGTRWIDARRYDRLAQLPLDRAGDVIHPHMLVPAGECDARGFSVPCSPLN